VESGPFVRSSYHAHEQADSAVILSEAKNPPAGRDSSLRSE
jgi:hypothetical protein